MRELLSNLAKSRSDRTETERRLSALAAKVDMPGFEKGTFYFSCRGRPRGFMLDSNPNRLAVRRCQLSVPKGVPRLTL